MFLFPLSLLIVVVSFRLSEQEQSGNRCPNGWEHFDDTCYAFGKSKETWASAQAICAAHGAKLAEIDNERENEFLKNMAKSKSAERTWLGGTDQFKDGDWIWASNNRPLSYTNWGPGQPNNYGGSQDCMTYLKRDGYSWDDENCNEQVNFICEERRRFENSP